MLKLLMYETMIHYFDAQSYTTAVQCTFQFKCSPQCYLCATPREEQVSKWLLCYLQGLVVNSVCYPARTVEQES